MGPHLEFPDWQIPCFAALSGTFSPEPELLGKAERAILARLEQLVMIPGREMEKHAIRMSLHNLRGINKGKLGFRSALLLI